MTEPAGNENIIDGKYRVEKLLGKGGMGSVHLATHIGTGRPVAVKLIATQFMRREEFVERFRREAQAAGRLRHPNVVDVTDFGFSVDSEGRKTAYLVMEYLDGCSLGEVLDEERNLPLDFTVDIIEQVCSAVAEAHRQGIIHRDLKPDNIWLEPNQRGGYTVKVLDFGIAKLEESTLELPDSDEFLVRDSSQSSLSSSKKTIADSSGDQTIADNEPGTVAGDGSTIALADEGATIALPDEGATGILVEPDDEAGTRIQDSAEDENLMEAGTLISGSASSTGESEIVDKKGTRLVSGADNTDRDSKSAGTSDLTKVGAVLGTPLYMSPEQCRGEKLTPKSDIYALAVVVYQMLSGDLPFNGDYVAVMDGHKNEDPPALEVKKVPKRFKGIVMQSLAKDSESRAESADTFSSELRSNSEGVGGLVRRAIVVYGQHLPKFLLLALICFSPLILITGVRVTVGLLLATEVIQSEAVQLLNVLVGGVFAFFIQVISVALLSGMTVWIVGRTITFPLRPISLRSAIAEVRKRWKSLAWTVSLSTIVVFAAMIIGFVIFGLSIGLAAVVGIYWWIGAIIGALLALPFVAFFHASLMMVAPTVMMESLSGLKAFKRSYQLFRRWTLPMVGVSAFNFIVPILLAAIIGVGIASAIQVVNLKAEVEKMRKEGVVAEKDLPKSEKKKSGTNLNFSLGNKGVSIDDENNKGKEDEEKDMRKQVSEAIQAAVFELFWIPISFLIVSFVTVLTALIYFKLRQAGGESHQELLGKLEGEYQIKARWEQSIRERLVQSGKMTTTK